MVGQLSVSGPLHNAEFSGHRFFTVFVYHMLAPFSVPFIYFYEGAHYARNQALALRPRRVPH